MADATKSAFNDQYSTFTAAFLVRELRALAERDTRTIPWSQLFRSVIHQAANLIENSGAHVCPAPPQRIYRANGKEHV
jgi:hypothetical protein